jgi:hypothetical protein
VDNDPELGLQVRNRGRKLFMDMPTFPSIAEA